MDRNFSKTVVAPVLGLRCFRVVLLPFEQADDLVRTLRRVHRAKPGSFRIASVPNLKPFWYFSLYEPPFRVRSL